MQMNRYFCNVYLIKVKLREEVCINIKKKKELAYNLSNKNHR